MDGSSNNSGRDTVRAELARIDEQVLALIAERLQVDARGFEAPSVGAPLRPALELQILRALLGKAPAHVEPETIVEIWRALLTSGDRKQRMFDVVVGGPRQDPVRLYDIARRHFGARTRISHVGDPQAALMRVVENPNSCVAVTPWPSAPGVGSWWPALSESRFHKLHVIAGLPVLGAGESPEACVFSAAPNEETGKDVSLLLVEDPHHRLSRALQEAGLTGKELARSEPRALVRVDGFVASDDPRAKVMAGTVERARVLGSYARI